MRNLLIILMLCALTLTTSNVFAEGYDASKRSERLGLSFYDGRPMFLLRINYNYSNAVVTDPKLEVFRLKTGDVLENDERYYAYYGYLAYTADGRKYIEAYGYNADGELEPLTLNKGLSSLWCVKLIETQGPGQLALASTGDVAVDIFDALLKPLQEWLGGALGFWLAIGVVFLGWQYLRRLARGGVAIGGKSAEVEASNEDFLEGFRRRRAEKLAAEQEREKFESFQKAWGAIRELGEADAYATGEAFGLTFTDKVVKSNLILHEAWSRLSEDERRFLANEARALAWQDDLIGEKEKIYRQSVMETALGDLDGVDASSVFSNPFEDATYYDDDNGGTPF